MNRARIEKERERDEPPFDILESDIIVWVRSNFDGKVFTIKWVEKINMFLRRLHYSRHCCIFSQSVCYKRKGKQRREDNAGIEFREEHKHHKTTKGKGFLGEPPKSNVTEGTNE